LLKLAHNDMSLFYFAMYFMHMRPISISRQLQTFFQRINKELMMWQMLIGRIQPIDVS
jgi:hypothetical protein